MIEKSNQKESRELIEVVIVVGGGCGGSASVCRIQACQLNTQQKGV